jgi:hypothetical protein
MHSLGTQQLISHFTLLHETHNLHLKKQNTIVVADRIARKL